MPGIGAGIGDDVRAAARRSRRHGSRRARTSSTIARPWCMRPCSRCASRSSGPASRWRARASPTSTSSTAMPLAPKPPPTSGATTRTCSSARARAVAPRTILSWWGVWDEIHIVSRPSSPNWAARGARLDRAGPDPLADQTGPRRRRRLTRAGSDRGHPRAGGSRCSCPPGEQQHLVLHRLDRDRLPPATRRSRPSTNSAASTLASRRVSQYDGHDVAHEPDRVAGEKRPVQLGTDGRIGGAGLRSEVGVGRGEHLAPVASAADLSIPVILACAMYERTNVTCSAPGSCRSST